MKNKYQRLTKEEKRKAKQEYRESNESNANIYNKVKRLIVLCVAGIIYALIMFVVDFLLTNSVWDFVIDGVLLIFCLLFLLKVISILNNQVNNYLINKDKIKPQVKKSKKR